MMQGQGWDAVVMVVARTEPHQPDRTNPKPNPEPVQPALPPQRRLLTSGAFLTWCIYSKPDTAMPITPTVI